MPSEVLHKPASVTLDDFVSGSFHNLSYDVDVISQMIVLYIRQGNFPKQDEAKEDFEYEGHWNLGNPENRADLMRLFRLYNNAYFNGLLTFNGPLNVDGLFTNICRIELIAESSAARRDGGRTSPPSGFCEIFRPGEERNPRYRIRNPWAKITITQNKDDGNPFQRIQRYQTALLHQMLHAMFLLYTCVRKQGCAQSQQSGFQVGGHHLAWQAAARAIEEADKIGGSIFGFGTDLSRNKCMAEDMDKGYNLQGDAALRSVGLDICEILRYRDEIREENAERRKNMAMTPDSLQGSSCLRRHWTIPF